MPRRIATKTKVILFKTKNPFMRTSEIAKKMGYHRSYIHKILKENGLPTKIPSGLKNRYVYCAECKELVMTIKRKNRYNEKKAKKTFCSTACKTNHYNIELTCTYCREVFKRPKSVIIQGYRRDSNHVYCSQKCFRRTERLRWGNEDIEKSILDRLSNE